MSVPVTPVDYKEFLLKKLSHSVISSVVSQLMVLVVYVFLCNYSLLHPIDSTILTVKVFTSFGTWLFLFPFLAIIFAQSIICGKYYVCKTSYAITRFQKFLSIFSLQNWAILVLNVIVGGSLTCIFLQLKGTSPQDPSTNCKSDEFCLNEDYFYLILGGIWNAVYYFYVIHMSDLHPMFPVVYQRKTLQVKSKLLPLFKDSCVLALTPAICFVIFYSIFGDILITKFVQFFEIKSHGGDMGMMVYIYLWFYGVLYYFKMNLMRTFFNIFLTEPVMFPLQKLKDTSFYLQDGINMSNLPIIQSLACLDLYNLSHYSTPRRKILFTLSQPGGHPHNWNSLIQNVLKLFSNYIETMHGLMETFDTTPKIPEIQPKQLNPIDILSPNKFSNIRNMSLISDVAVPDVVELSLEPIPLFAAQKEMIKKLKKKLTDFFSFLKMILGINYLFGVLPQANIDSILANGQVIIWCSQGIAELASVSLAEDDYGIVQKDLPAIITTLVELNQNFEKLNKLPALTRKVMDYQDYNFKMKNAVVSAVKRSLFNIYYTFEEYLDELPLNKSVSSYLHAMFRN